MNMDTLVAALWEGNLSERDFIQDAVSLGLSLEEVLEELSYLKSEDGVS